MTNVQFDFIRKYALDCKCSIPASFTMMEEAPLVVAASSDAKVQVGGERPDAQQVDIVVVLSKVG
jgi:hypothetical protein